MRPYAITLYRVAAGTFGPGGASAHVRARTQGLPLPSHYLKVLGGATRWTVPGGWAAIVIRDGKRQELKGSSGNTTSNRMELTAAIEGLASTSEKSEVAIHSDSQYLVKTMTLNWKPRRLVSIPLQGFMPFGPDTGACCLMVVISRLNPSAGIHAFRTSRPPALLGTAHLGLHPSAGIHAFRTSGFICTWDLGGNVSQSLCRDSCLSDYGIVHQGA